MTRLGFWPLATLAVLGACAPSYQYHFEMANPAELAGPDVVATVELDPTQAHELTLTLTNHTQEPVQVSWSQIRVIGPDGKHLHPRPEADLGWVAPSATVTARLSPFILPAQGAEARSYEGAHFDVEVPMVVNHVSKTPRYALVAHVSELKGKRQ